MAMDIELQAVNNPENRIKVLIPHWEMVLKPQGRWTPVEQEPTDAKQVRKGTTKQGKAEA
jgi:hypothetical protein